MTRLHSSWLDSCSSFAEKRSWNVALMVCTLFYRGVLDDCDVPLKIIWLCIYLKDTNTIIFSSSQGLLAIPKIMWLIVSKPTNIVAGLEIGKLLSQQEYYLWWCYNIVNIVPRLAYTPSIYHLEMNGIRNSLVPSRRDGPWTWCY